MAQSVHRASGLKQQNKKHNKLGHKTKGQIKSLSQGRLSIQSVSRKAKHDLSRVERRNQVKVIRADKKEKNLMKKRKLGTESQPPFLVCVLLLDPSLQQEAVLAALRAADAQSVVTVSEQNITHVSCTRFKQRFAFVVPKCDDLYSILDTVKVCTTLLLVWPCSTDEDLHLGEDQQRVLSAVKAQGLPTPVHAALGYHDLAHKRAARCMQQLMQEVRQYFPGDDKAKVHLLEKPGDALLCLRQIGSQKQRALFYRDHRPHLLADQLSFHTNCPFRPRNNLQLLGIYFLLQVDSGSTGTLAVTGFLRGASLSPNDLVHLPGWGDYQLLKVVEHSSDPHPLILGGSRKANVATKADDIVYRPDHNQCSLAATRDDVKGEESSSDDSGQESDGEDSDDGASSVTARSLKSLTAVPIKKDRIPGAYCAKSDYQAAWMIDNEAFKQDFGGCSDEEESDDSEDEFQPPDARSDDEESMVAPDDDDSMSVVSSSEYGEDAYDDKMDYQREMDEYQRMKDMREDLEFPDEVDTPRDIPARERFIKYRGLESFRSSPWDLNENLPEDYSKIFHIPRFEHYRKRVLADAKLKDNAVECGRYVTVYIKEVPTHAFEEHKVTGSPLVLFGLLLHEAKMSLVNLVLKSHPVGHTRPIKSKDRLIFHVGFRRYINQPIFSDHTAGDKQKFCRYFHPGMTVVASMYAPVTFPPASVLAFRQLSGNRQELVATGSVYTVNADRCVLKRIILSGHPFKIHKRSVVVRYMFFDRDDINWFKPIELRTKWGRKGNIKEALGTHGHMKCMFNGTLKSQDTILLHLYKRVFPKWTYNPSVPRGEPLYTSGVYPLENKSDVNSDDEEDCGKRRKIEKELQDKYLMPPPSKKQRKVRFS
ncbi:hypothetical protein HAZT_HAZT001232 [Hyalella azteca]|uniref:Pre-rRNA-processing protein TSR1 homolog n=1 Tax=Hyalella azteca TaxID=294128 RepID=A0A6A0H524_HYAAZ|nr:hypothetical protein HAZT_HAZT001232 [Hyalella azteca]